MKKQVGIIALQGWSFAVETRLKDLETFSGIDTSQVDFHYISMNPNIEKYRHEEHVLSQAKYGFISSVTHIDCSFGNLSAFKHSVQVAKQVVRMDRKFDFLIVFNPITQESQEPDAIAWEQHSVSTVGKLAVEHYDSIQYAIQSAFYYMCSVNENVRIIRMVHDPNEIAMRYLPNRQVFVGDLKNTETLWFDSDGKTDGFEVPYYYIPAFHKSLVDSRETIQKEHLFTFGFTNHTGNTVREKIHTDLSELAEQCRALEQGLFVGTKESDNRIVYIDYLARIKRSRFTYVIPSYNKDAFSHRRFWEAIVNGCVPIIDPEAGFERAYQGSDLLTVFQKYGLILRDRMELVHVMGERKYDYYEIVEDIKQTLEYKQWFESDTYKSIQSRLLSLILKPWL